LKWLLESIRATGEEEKDGQTGTSIQMVRFDRKKKQQKRDEEEIVHAKGRFLRKQKRRAQGRSVQRKSITATQAEGKGSDVEIRDHRQKHYVTEGASSKLKKGIEDKPPENLTRR